MQRDNWVAVKRAADIYRFAGNIDPAWRLDAVKALSSHGLWSLAHIVAITGVSMHDVRRTVSKSDHSGGRFNPTTLQLILEEFELAQVGQDNPMLTAQIVREGTSVGMLAKLLDQPITRVRTRALRGATEGGAHG